MGVKKGNIPWNKGLKGEEYSKHYSNGFKKKKPKIKIICECCGKEFLHEHWQKRKYCSKKCYGKTITNKTRIFTEKWKENISNAMIGNIPWNKGINSDEYAQHYKNGFGGTPKGNIPWNTGLTKEVDERILKYSGSNHGMWNGGISFEPYDTKFNNNLKKQIRDRDKHICQICNCKENGRCLDVHHIDYNKKNSNPDNLIALCHSCHTKTNKNREKWINLLQTKLLKKIE